ncbi:MAG: TspO/MBR family protein [Polyangiales bacterium]
MTNLARVSAGTAFMLGVNALARIGVGDQRTFYRKLDTPSWSPPGWVFAPVWTFNNVTRIAADIALLERPKSPARTAALAFEGLNWLCYAAFSPLFFGLKSPVLGFVTSVVQTAATIGAAIAGRKLGKRFLGGLLPTGVWLLFASALAGTIMTRNRDRVFG